MAWAVNGAQTDKRALLDICAGLFARFVLTSCPVAKEVEFGCLTTSVCLGVENRKGWLRYWKDEEGIWVKRFI